MDPVESRIRRIGDDHITNTWLAAYHTMPYDRLVREKLSEIAEALWEFGGLSKAGVDFGDYIQYLKTAARDAEKIGEMQAKTLHYKGGTYVLEPLNGKIEGIEEMHQLAEHLKKLLPEKIVEVEEKPKFPEAKRVGASAPADVRLEAQKLLGMLNGLKFADYSEKAVEKALRELGAEVEKLLEEKNLELLGVYSMVFLLLERGEFERAEEFLKGLNS